MEFPKQSAEVVPSWDGNPRGWRRYQREVMWFCLGTKRAMRRFLAPRLISKLTGSARLLAMSWPQQEFAGKNGVSTLLQRLSQSPLVRKNLPNTQAILNQYFNYKRHQGESIANYLVRETLYFEEFTESLMALHEESLGKPVNLFEIPDSSSEDESSTDSASSKSGKKKDAYRQVPTEDPDEAGLDSPSSRRERRQEEASPSRRSRREPSERAEADGWLGHTLSPMDSFILKQLRGWRLLSGALLSTEDVRSVMAPTNNKLDYESISIALTILFDEQLQPVRHGFPSSSGPQVFSIEEEPWEDDYWSTWDPWANSMDWWEDDWSYYEADYGATEPELHPAEEEGEKRGSEEAEAQSAERSWSQAHRSTQLARKDRGFGAAVSQSKGSGKSEGCFICGGNHGWRDCPDRNSPFARSKGFGKQNYWLEDDSLYAMQKGKGKGKPGFSKGNHYNVEELYYMKGKGYGGKGKSKGKMKSKNKGTVNAYALSWPDHYSFGLEFEKMEPSTELQANASEMSGNSSGKHMGMLDTGATCSAGPESSLKLMIQSVLAKDAQTKLTFDMKKRPRFRFGSGRWGKALYKITIQSSLSDRQFNAYALPDPPEVSEEWFNEDHLVPVLVGMDFIYFHGLIIDFSDGFAVCARQTDGKPFYLPRNDKGHYMLDIAQFLTKGQSCPNGHPEINVLMDHEEHDQNWIEQMSRMTSTPSFFLQPLMFEREECEMEFCPALKSSEHQLFFELWNRRKHHNGRLGLMGSVLSETFATTSSTRSLVSHGAQEDSDSGHRLCEKGGAGSKRPEIQGNTVAMSGTSCPQEPAREQVGALDPLRSLRSTIGVPSNCGSSGRRHQESEPGYGAASSGRNASFIACRDDAVGGALQGGLGQGDGGRKDEDHVEGVPASMGESNEDGVKSSVEDEGIEWAKEFRRRGLRRDYITDEVYGKLGASASKSGEKDRESHGLPDGRREGTDSTNRRSKDVGARSGNVSKRQRGGVGTGLPLVVNAVKKDDANEIEENYETKNDEVNTHKLPLRVGEAMMETIHVINEGINSKVAETVYDKKPIVWEMFCSPQSELTKQCEHYGMEGMRINLANGYDLYKASTYDHLKELYCKKRPKKVWVST